MLPEELRQRSERSRVFAPATAARVALRGRLDALHEAVEARRVVRLEYGRADGAVSRRDVEPLCLAFWGQVWTLGGWCRLRRDFRSFRLDRILACAATEERFPEHPARGLAAFLEAMGAGGELEA